MRAAPSAALLWLLSQWRVKEIIVGGDINLFRFTEFLAVKGYGVRALRISPPLNHLLPQVLPNGTKELNTQTHTHTCAGTHTQRARHQDIYGVHISPIYAWDAVDAGSRLCPQSPIHEVDFLRFIMCRCGSHSVDSKNIYSVFFFHSLILGVYALFKVLVMQKPDSQAKPQTSA